MFGEVKIYKSVCDRCKKQFLTLDTALHLSWEEIDRKLYCKECVNSEFNVFDLRKKYEEIVNYVESNIIPQRSGWGPGSENFNTLKSRLSEKYSSNCIELICKMFSDKILTFGPYDRVFINRTLVKELNNK